MIWHNVEQNSEEWLTLRLGKATASQFGVIMAKKDGEAFGDPAKRYALQLALERITGARSVFSFSNDQTERGHAQEPIARALYESVTFCEVQGGGFFDCGEYGDSPDGLIGSAGVLEIKSVLASAHFDTLKRGNFDPSYKWQLAGHLDCSGRDWVDFVSYCADFPEASQLLIYRVTRADLASEIEALRQRRAAFLEVVKKVTGLIDGGSICAA